MRWSPEKLRWIVLGGALLLAGVVAALLGLANYRAGKIWQRILARNGVNLRRETNGFTYSQSDGKRTVFTLHAARAVPHGSGNWTLHDAVLVLYARDGRTDRIYGSQFQYDQEQGVARAVGEVHMDLEAPRASGAKTEASDEPDLSFTAGDPESSDPALIHVRTSGLVYVRKLGVAATSEPAEFRYLGLTCTSRGAEFDSGQDILRLLADVRLQGTLRRAPFTLSASRAELNRAQDTVDLLEPVLNSGQRSARAAHTALHLRRDGSLQSDDAEGEVQLREGTLTLSAPKMHAEFAPQDRPQTAMFSGEVHLLESNPARPAQGLAGTLQLGFDAGGLLQSAVAGGGVQLLTREVGRTGVATRALHAQGATASFVPADGTRRGAMLRTLHMAGAAELSGTSPATVAGQQPTTANIRADDLTTTFASTGAKSLTPTELAGAGHTELQQVRGDGSHETSTGDTLEVRFTPRPQPASHGTGGAVEVSSAVQTGGVVVHTWPVAHSTGAAEAQPAVGHSDKAVFLAAGSTLTLSGAGSARASVESGGTQLLARQIVLHQGSGDAEASGAVAATTGGESGAPATHVLSDRASLFREGGISQFFGTDAQPAQLWQAASQVKAAKIVLDGTRHTLSARPESPDGAVHAVFASAAGRPQAPLNAASRGVSSTPREMALGETRLPEASRDSVSVRAGAMDYSDAAHEATFRGGLQIVGTVGAITGEHGAVFLEPSPSGGTKAALPQGAAAIQSPATAIGGRLQRLVVLGDVHLRQPGRTGTGNQLTYTAASDSFVLTGTPGAPPRVDDAQQGHVTGTTLLFRAADSSIVVAGTPGTAKGAKPSRVHTETELKQQ